MPRNGSCPLQIRDTTTASPATRPKITGRAVIRRTKTPSTMPGKNCAMPSYPKISSFTSSFGYQSARISATTAMSSMNPREARINCSSLTAPPLKGR